MYVSIYEAANELTQKNVIFQYVYTIILSDLYIQLLALLMPDALKNKYVYMCSFVSVFTLRCAELFPHFLFFISLSEGQLV